MGTILEFDKTQEAGTVHNTYAEFKASLDAVVERVEEGFVEIGYHLKVARDTDILKESGYKSVFEFADAEYGLDKSAVSRFIAINDRFSVDGYSPRLQEQYQGLGRAKLSIMLLLPDGINGEITTGFSKADLTALREEIKEEEAVTDIERLLEGEAETQHEMTLLKKVLHQIGHDEVEVFRKMLEAAGEVSWNNRKEAINILLEAWAPSGESIHSVRIQGIGRIMFSVKEESINLVNARSGEKEGHSWDEILDALVRVFTPGEPENVWEKVYQEPYPENGKVAPVQQKGKVIKAKEEAEEKTEAEQKSLQSAAAGGVPEELNPFERPPHTGTSASKDPSTWKEPPEKKERKPIEPPPVDAEYLIPVGKTLFRDIRKGQRYLILKMQQNYRVGNTLILQEHSGGESTGQLLRLGVTHMTDDHGGITPGYCVVQFDILPDPEEQLPGQLEFGDMNPPETENMIGTEAEEESVDAEEGNTVMLPESWEEASEQEE